MRLSTLNKEIRASFFTARPYLFGSFRCDKPDASFFGVDDKDAPNRIHGQVKQIGHDNLSAIEAVTTSAELAIQTEVSQQFRHKLGRETQLIVFRVVGHVHLPFGLQQPARRREWNQKKTGANEGQAENFLISPFRGLVLDGAKHRAARSRTKLKNCLLEQQPLCGCCVRSFAPVLFWFHSSSPLALAHGPPPLRDFPVHYSVNYLNALKGGPFRVTQNNEAQKESLLAQTNCRRTRPTRMDG